MSHFYVQVLVPTKKMEDLDSYLEQVLEPYNENREVDEYKRRCWCVGQKAHSASIDKVNKKLGDIDKVRKKFYEDHPELKDQHEFNSKADPALVEKAEALWKEEVYTPREELEAQFYKEHPLSEKPDPECEECKGTGKEDTTYNPKSKWDWYSVGGRWTGALSDYNPEKDPRNSKRCDICGGTGKRDDQLGRDARAQDPSYTCNGCNGTGRALKWPTEWVQEDGIGNTAPLAEFLTRLEADPKKAAPYAFVTPDGEWHERAKMGWFGLSSNEKNKDEWHTEVLKTYRELPKDDLTVVVVDCHI